MGEAAIIFLGFREASVIIVNLNKSQIQQTRLVLYYCSTLPNMLVRKDPSNFRHNILCAIIAEQNIVIEDINGHKNPPGLKPEQSRFLKLVESISNGAKVIVVKGGTLMKFYSGLITNNQGVDLHFDCGLQRGISYYLEYVILLAMFGKTSLSMKLTGITDDVRDGGVDSIQQQLIPLLKDHFDFDNELSMKIEKRGYWPQGGGEVRIVVPAIRKIKRINLEDKGYIKRVRGICAGSKISTSILNTVKDKTKARLLQYLPDVWIHTDFFKGDKASNSPGYSLSLKAETTTGGIITFQSCFEGGTTEKFIDETVNCFLDEIQHSGYISTNYQWFLLTLMALSQKKTSSIKLGRLSPFTVECLRIIRDYFGIVFEIEESKSQNLAIFRCLGLGYQNYARIVK